MKKYIKIIKFQFIYSVASSWLLLLLFVPIASAGSPTTSTVQNPQNGAIGVEGTVPSPPPTVAASISSPGNGQKYTTIPVTISGICTTDLLVKIFKNNVFGGAVICKNGSYSIQIDLFSGINDIIARVYDDLDQAGPDSNVVRVQFVDNDSTNLGPRVSITSNYAKRGANPGTTFGWPLAVSGGIGPYAVSIDWGDGKTDLVSREFPGDFTPEHVYTVAGVYNVIVKVTDKNGVTAFLQLVAIANGVPGTDATGKVTPGAQPTSSSSTDTSRTKLKLVIWPVYILIPFIVSTFWLGKRHTIFVIRKKLQRGEHPFHK